MRSAREGAREEHDPMPRAYVTAPPDTLLFSVVAILVGIGLVMIFSASSATAFAATHDSMYFLKRQLIWLAVAGVAAFFAYRIDYHRLKQVAPVLLVVSIVSLILVLIPHVGILTNGARRWL
ncbi:MAG: FtsW/RodA/SpoVE family cell cycle protein, partial [Candidatus Eremiobacteraeota bacterium]|nr:FtsW/RodA/SpoVE family cell cycle protein [Candidatus Eremiobacteraeota bacterium]